MTRDDILDAIRMLAQSQGFYGRLLVALNDLDPDDFDRVMDDLESRHFADVVDLVMFLES